MNKSNSRPQRKSQRRELIYTTLREARIAARKLGATSAREYIKRYKEDERLPSNPSTYYADWAGWADYLGVADRNDRFYRTIKAASMAARRLGVQSAREYIQQYRHDPRLPSNPSQFYTDWVSWPHFLG